MESKRIWKPKTLIWELTCNSTKSKSYFKFFSGFQFSNKIAIFLLSFIIPKPHHITYTSAFHFRSGLENLGNNKDFESLFWTFPCLWKERIWGILNPSETAMCKAREPVPSHLPHHPLISENSSLCSISNCFPSMLASFHPLFWLRIKYTNPKKYKKILKIS